jgi:transposase
MSGGIFLEKSHSGKPGSMAKPIKRRARVTEEFKRQAVQKYRDRGKKEVREITAELGIVNSQLHRWVKQFPEELKDSPRASKVNGAADLRTLPDADRRGELARLRREVAQLSEECEVLKKTIVVFARTR